MSRKLAVAAIVTSVVLSTGLTQADAKSKKQKSDRNRQQTTNSAPAVPAASTNWSDTSTPGTASPDADVYQQDGNFLRSNVIYNEPGAPTRLSRQAGSKSPGTTQQAMPTVPEPPPVSSSKFPKLESQTPIADMRAAQTLLQQTLDATFYACDYLILTGVNSRQLTVQEELELRTEMDGLLALNKSYAAKGYTKDTFNEIQRKLVILQLHIYTYGQNGPTR